ncbi:MAG: hypothetical protein ABMB14_36095 [Myxococcota bacterium]
MSPLDPPTSPPDVIEVVEPGVRIDWTTLELEVTASADAAGPEALDAAEQMARRRVDDAYQKAVGSVWVTNDARVADLVADGELGTQIRSRVSKWEVDEATYRASGRVELRATLSLQELLRPWALQIARPGVPPTDAPSATGVVIDARDLGVRPSYALRLVSSDDRVLYAGELWEEQAVRVPPYRFVTHPGHPAAAEAGPNPVLLIADEVRGTNLVLSDAEIVRLGETVLGQTTVIVVVGE